MIYALTDKDKHLVKESWRLVEAGSLMETATKIFYDRLFETNPELRTLFPEDLEGQIKKLANTINFSVKALSWKLEEWHEGGIILEESDLFVIVRSLGRRHTRLYQVTAPMYQPVGNALLFALDMGLGEAFTTETKLAWTKLYVLLSNTMKMGGIMKTAEDLATQIQEEAK